MFRYCPILTGKSNNRTPLRSIPNNKWMAPRKKYLDVFNASAEFGVQDGPARPDRWRTVGKSKSNEIFRMPIDLVNLRQQSESQTANTSSQSGYRYTPLYVLSFSLRLKPFSYSSESCSPTSARGCPFGS